MGRRRRTLDVEDGVLVGKRYLLMGRDPVVYRNSV
jgi:hypothetical protein